MDLWWVEKRHQCCQSSTLKFWLSDRDVRLKLWVAQVLSTCINSLLITILPVTFRWALVTFPLKCDQICHCGFSSGPELSRISPFPCRHPVKKNTAKPKLWETATHTPVPSRLSQQPPFPFIANTSLKIAFVYVCVCIYTHTCELSYKPSTYSKEPSQAVTQTTWRWHEDSDDGIWWANETQQSYL